MTYIHVVDSSGQHWLRDKAQKHYFNGANWIKNQGETVVEVAVVGECTIEEFLQELSDIMNYREAL